MRKAGRASVAAVRRQCTNIKGREEEMASLALYASGRRKGKEEGKETSARLVV